ncbi:MAG TPA: iron ABC transporter permease [Thermoflexales bacterium]|nr:iron ABC transporter permease [Thermoflexales bacterium]
MGPQAADGRPQENRTALAAVRRLPSAVPLALPFAFLAVFLCYPLATIGALSAAPSAVSGGELVATLLRPEAYFETVVLSAAQAGASTLLTLALGLPAAYAFARYRFRGDRLLRALAGVPFVMPAVVVAAAFAALLGPRGLANTALQGLLGLDQPPIQLLGTLPMILIAHAFYNVSVVIRIVGGFWSAIDPRLESAAATLGASRWQTLWRVTLPLALPAIGSAAALVFLFTFGSFGVVLLLGNARWATLEVEIYRQTAQLLRLDVAAALALIQMLATVALGLVNSRLQARTAAPLAMRLAADTRAAPRGPGPRALACFAAAVSLLLCGLPLAALVAGSLPLDGGLDPNSLFRYFIALERNPRGSAFFVPPLEAIRNSVTAATATAGLALALGLPLAVGMTADRRRGPVVTPALLDALLLLPLGTSAVTLGLGYIVAFNRPPLQMVGSPWLIPLAHTLIALPFVVRTLTPALRALDPRLRQAAAVLGSPPWRARLEIDLPLLAQPLIAALAFAFATSLGEFGASLLISRPEFPTVPVVIARLLSQPGALNYGQALAMSSLLMGVTAAGMLLIDRLQPNHEL